ANAVSIMTVHASKGLEFPIVIVPDLAEPFQAGGNTVMVEDGLRIGVTIPNPANDHEREEAPILKVLKREYRQKEKAEQKRLFYVAVTRAKDHLVLCGELPGEVPKTLEEAKNRMGWLAHCIGLCDDVYIRGAAEITIPGEESPLCISLVTDPAAICAEPQQIGLIHLSLPDDGTVAGVSEGIPPIQVDEEEHTYSASEIRQYLHCPLAYERKFRLNITTQPIREASGAMDATTRGLIVHEVFRGRDPGAVLRRYGVEDDSIVGEYQTLYDRFRTAEVMQEVTNDYCEVPFRTSIGGVKFKGAIDRLVRRPDGTWVLIDYKTGVAGVDDIPEKVEDYAVQITIYRLAAEHILGEAVKPFLYFVDSDRWVEVKGDGQRVPGEILDAVSGIERQLFRMPECEGCNGKDGCRRPGRGA
ncbi:MAG: 3'-5' exonuclease, partial [Methanoculleus sp.]|nr:3'-5' exonuclease [Methanoculleus sp.]